MAEKKFKETRSYETIMNGLWRDHPIFSMVLGICSALAVSNTLQNAIAMGAGVTFVLVATATLISLLRKLIPRRVRMITYMVMIASFVIIVDLFLQAFFPDISASIGPYVGLIITNCIIMGRAEAFSSQNPLGLSILDALSNGIAYTYTLATVAVIREVLGFGTLLGYQVTPEGWTNWVVMAMAPGAFFVVALFIWISRTLTGIETD
ncbi:MAG TPA: NADH:ubiquinone reductase (Na(+)-transporting) subunit D [Sediminispirochaeta sp.]|nr:NADH:ubiquinone reductase (Na(+)-transporting) subunit D [Sediminispirochaeta sp.]